MRSAQTDGTVRWSEFLRGSTAERRRAVGMAKYGNGSCHSYSYTSETG